MVDLTPKQTAFLLVPHREVLFGGAAGGGKSVGVLAAASQYLDVPGYSALILRQTYRDLALAGALMDMAHQWWKSTAARWRAADYTWIFPSGATCTFGYLEREADKYRYQGSEFQYIGFDELTQFETESRYLYLFSRMRRIKEFEVPLRIRAATNPGGIGHEWVKRRFITNPTDDRIFIPSFLDDNPYLDQVEYDLALAELDPTTRMQLRQGDWEVDPRGGMFKRNWFNLIDAPPSDLRRAVRYWDLAASTEEEFRDPDWTVGTRMHLTDEGTYVIDDIKRFRATPKENEDIIHATALKDGFDVPIFMEQEPGSSGKTVIDHYRRNVLRGWQFRADKEYRTTKKEIRAKPFSAAAEDGLVSLVISDWISPWLDEHIIFPDGTHDDQVDSAVGAFQTLNKLVRGEDRHVKAKQSYGYGPKDE
jgi:predicted phage terminase large subunit-like protein